MEAKAKRHYTLSFNPTTIEHLGLKLYASLPPVIGELVSNAWDADAHRVEITIPGGAPTDKSEVIVVDDGHGMSPDALQNAYLQIGRNRRSSDGTERSPGGRVVTGRKGLGKLSVFGVATELEVRTVTNGSAECIRLNYDDMRDAPADTPYEPTVVEERSGPTSDAHGTEVRIRKLRRQRPIDVSWVRRELARRFTLIGADFVVRVTGTPIEASERRLRQECQKSWDASDLPDAGVVDAKEDLRVTGWVGFLGKASQQNRGVDIFARGKAVALSSMFALSTTHAQFARAYVVGEVHAEFLDEDDDLITTARSDAQWDTPRGEALSAWGSNALTFVFSEWNRTRREIKANEIEKNADLDAWLKTRTPREQRVAMRIIDTLIEDDAVDAEAARPLVDVVKTNIEIVAFQELLDDVESSGGDVPTLLRLVKDWRVVEARELVRISEGQLAVMEQLASYIEKGALEVQQMQPLFEQSPWLIDPMWSGLTGQTRYTDMLRRQFPDTAKVDEEKRIDILGITAGSDLHVVELKRPEKTLAWEDLDQIERYVTWARTNIASQPPAPRLVQGRLIVGKFGSKAEVQRRRENLAGQGISVYTYDDLLQQARTVYGWLRNTLERVAPEYANTAKRTTKAPPRASPSRAIAAVPASETAPAKRKRARRGSRGGRNRRGGRQTR